MDPSSSDTAVGRYYREAWIAWPVYWSATWVGGLAAVVTTLIFGLGGIALGAYTAQAHPLLKWSSFGLGALVFSVFGAFISFVVGGWVTGKIAGLRRSEPAMLHGAIAWLVAVPLLLVLVALGAGSYFGSWLSGLAGTPVWVTPTSVAVDPNAAIAAKNSALGAVAALLLGLVGGVIGGWLAAGEPMTFTHHATRTIVADRKLAGPAIRNG
jgi:hypothetical protein